MTSRECARLRRRPVTIAKQNGRRKSRKSAGAAYRTRPKLRTDISLLVTVMDLSTAESRFPCRQIRLNNIIAKNTKIAGIQ